MKKKIFIGMAMGILLVGVAGNSQAEDTGKYFSANIGVANVADTGDSYGNITEEYEFDMGTSITVAVGRDYGNFRLEAELGHQRSDMGDVKVSVDGIDVPISSASGEATSSSLLVNGYLDIENDSDFTPFLTFGVGVASSNLEDFTVEGVSMPDIEEDGVAYQFGFGGTWKTTESRSFEVKYRYYVPPEIADVEVSSHNIYAGMIFKF